MASPSAGRPNSAAPLCQPGCNRRAQVAPLGVQRNSVAELEAQLAKKDAQLAKKDAVIAEISEEFVKVKKTLGEP